MLSFDPALDRPHLRYNYTWFLPGEKEFDPVRPTTWMQKHWTQSIVLSALYVIFIYGGRYVMRNRPGYELKWPLILWNSGLAIFSIIGMVRFAPDFIWFLWKFGFAQSLCICAYHHGVTGFWTEMFALSKAIELGDTAFLVLRKRPIIFLHWYHHITVMIYTWHAFKDHTAAGKWFMMMNYSVHSLMYTYYALRAAGVRFPKFIPMAITISQLSQMVVGIVVAIGTYRIKRAGGECQQTDENLQLAFAMYFSYFLLFAHFFYLAYFKTAKYDRKIPHLKAANGVKPVANGFAMEANGLHKAEANGHLVSNGSMVIGDRFHMANGFDKVEANGHVKSSAIPNGVAGEHINGEVQNGYIRSSTKSISSHRKYD